MRLLLAFSTALLAVLALSGSTAGAPGGQGETLALEGGNGAVQLRGRGVVIGRIDQGYVQIVDQSPSDQWSPRLYGVPRGKHVAATGKEMNFIVPGGRYKILVRGTGISISARGEGVVQIAGVADQSGAAGTVRVGDEAPRAIPGDEALRIPFGDSASSDAQGGNVRGSSRP